MGLRASASKLIRSARAGLVKLRGDGGDGVHTIMNDDPAKVTEPPRRCTLADLPRPEGARSHQADKLDAPMDVTVLQTLRCSRSASATP